MTKFANAIATFQPEPRLPFNIASLDGINTHELVKLARYTERVFGRRILPVLDGLWCDADFSQTPNQICWIKNIRDIKLVPTEDAEYFLCLCLERRQELFDVKVVFGIYMLTLGILKVFPVPTETLLLLIGVFGIFFVFVLAKFFSSFRALKKATENYRKIVPNSPLKKSLFIDSTKKFAGGYVVRIVQDVITDIFDFNEKALQLDDRTKIAQTFKTVIEHFVEEELEQRLTDKIRDTGSASVAEPSDKTRSKVNREYGSLKELDEQLIQAVTDRNVGDVKHLITAGANPRKRNELGYTAIDYARGRGFLDIQAILEHCE